jgi:hypothetical protein
MAFLIENFLDEKLYIWQINRCSAVRIKKATPSFLFIIHQVSESTDVKSKAQ